MKTQEKKDKVDFGVKDRVLVTYKSKWYDIVDVPGIIEAANRTSGWPFRIRLQDADGKPINLGHDDDGGAPGSGPVMHCDEKHLTMVEKYVPKRLNGKVKNVWKVGEGFIPKEGFCLDQHDTDTVTGVLEDMVGVAGEEMTIATITNVMGVDWIIDGTHNFFWLKEWIDPVE